MPSKTPPPFDGSQILILSSIEWDAAWQRHQIFAAQLAEAGHEVFFVENTGFRGFRLSDISRILRRIGQLFRGSATPADAPERIQVATSPVLPPTRALFRWLNRIVWLPKLARRLRALGLKPGAAAIVYLPTPTSLELLRILKPRSVLYDCASHFAGHPNAPKDFDATERALLDASSAVVADSDFLFTRLKSRHPRVSQIHQGVSERFLDAAPPSPDWRRLCYYGTWIPDLDCAYLNALADAGFPVTLSGFIKGPPPALRDSIERLGPVARERLVDRLENFDVFLMPHKLTEFHRGVIPAKLYECMAMGRPIIAAPLESLKPLKGLIYISDSPKEWVHIAKNLPKTETAELRSARVELAKKHTHAYEFQRFHGALRSAWELV